MCRTRNLLCADRRRTSQVEVDIDDRRHLAVGSAVPAAMSHLWTAQQTQDFLQITARMYPHAPGSDIEGNDTARVQLIRWGVVACTLAMYEPRWLPELEAAASGLLDSRQRKYVLDTLGEYEALGLELADEAERYRSAESLDSARASAKSITGSIFSPRMRSRSLRSWHSASRNSTSPPSLPRALRARGSCVNLGMPNLSEECPQFN